MFSNLKLRNRSRRRSVPRVMVDGIDFGRIGLGFAVFCQNRLLYLYVCVRVRVYVFVRGG